MIVNPDSARAQLRELHERERAGLEVYLAAVGRATSAGVMPAPEAKVMTVGQSFARIARKDTARSTAPAKPAKPRGRKPHRATGRRAAIVEAIGLCGETFTAEELIERGKLDMKVLTLSGTLKYWASAGYLGISVRGGGGAGPAHYRRGIKWKVLVRKSGVEAEAEPEEEPAPAEPAPAPAVKRSGRPVSRNGHNISNQQIAVEQMFDGSADGAVPPLEGSHPTAVVVRMFKERFPHLLKSENDETNLRTRLIDMSRAGKIVRSGIGPDACYSRMV